MERKAPKQKSGWGSLAMKIGKHKTERLKKVAELTTQDGPVGRSTQTRFNVPDGVW
jgi:hypothetical protein